MKLFLAGAEKGSHRSILLSAGVTRLAVNLTHLPIPKKKEFVPKDIFQNAELLIYTSENDENVGDYTPSSEHMRKTSALSLVVPIMMALG